MTAATFQAAIAAGQFTMEELQQLNKAIVAELNADHKKKVAAAKQKFKVGDKVKFKHMSGTIIKINRTKCVVDTGDFMGRYSVPMTMLRK